MNNNFKSALVGLLLVGCTSGNKNSQEGISGAYVREYSNKVTNPETNQEIGMRTIRDTIFVRSLNDEIEVSNHKWMMNDYDNEGWRSMVHSDDRPKPTYRAVFDNESGSLRSTDGTALFLDKEKRAVHWSEGMDYQLVKP
ncbi:MAG: hypothetical protein JST46_10705 [Bacteroidetes bacterium]|nr:hypothetical protein [Bacteroidota bacterium]